MTLNFTETLLDEKNSDFSNKNIEFFKEFYNENVESGRALNIIRGFY